MNNTLLRVKVRQRLNKLSSQDMDNIEDWMIMEAVNKAQIEWTRRQLHGNNATKEGDESSTTRIDDLQVLLTIKELTGKEKNLFFESDRIPFDYMRFKRVSTKATNDCCSKPRIMTVYQGEEADADLYLNDKNVEPNFEWGETFCTLFNNRVRIYTEKKFTLVDPKLIYYRLPNTIKFKGVMDPETGTFPTKDTESEFKDDIMELIIDEAVSILAGDIESLNQFQRGSQTAERNN